MGEDNNEMTKAEKVFDVIMTILTFGGLAFFLWGMGSCMSSCMKHPLGL